MGESAINSVGVAGAGTMGSGIAQVCAMADFTVLLYDQDILQLDRAQDIITRNLDKGIEKGKVTQEQKEKTLENIKFISDLEKLKADLIIEAILEKLEPKQELFKTLEHLNGAGTLYATNTSSIPVTRIGQGLVHKERLVGLHFFNPAHIMKLVEIIEGEDTSPESMELAHQFVVAIGKKGVLAKDEPGFIVNRVARHFYVESLKLAEEGVAKIPVIDRLLESSGFRMGPFRLMDLIGVDTNYAVTSSMYESFRQDPKFRPSRMQYKKVIAGHHGRKSGKGFYDY